MSSKKRFVMGPKHFVFLIALALLAPVAATANQSTCLNGAPGALCIYNEGGTATSGVGKQFKGLTVGGKDASTLNIIGLFGGPKDDLGTVSFTTGGLLSGTLGGDATFGDGTFTIATNANYPYYSGVVFQGTFGNSAGGAPINWTYTGKVGKYYDYTLSGIVSGTWEGRGTVSGVTTQLFFESKTKFNGGTIALASGTTTFITPEPGTLGLMGMGLLGAGLMTRRRIKTATAFS
jgi:PEP-CTERM motif-containing protein